MSNPKTLTVTKQNVADIIGAWWKDYETNPGKYKPGPDFEGKSSADCFFEFAEKLGVGK